MKAKCPTNAAGCKRRPKLVKTGRFYRKSDRHWIQRFRCPHCGKNFSLATHSPSYKQKKRHLNVLVLRQLASGTSLRRTARLLRIHRTTVARKLTFLGLYTRFLNLQHRNTQPPSTEIQFDDLETFEHSKMKPLSVTLAVEKHTRRILGFEVARMPAKGLLSEKSVKKYGLRPDQRSESRSRLFRRLKPHIDDSATLESDENPHYTSDVKEHFPNGVHVRWPGGRGCLVGQGELKQLKFDPLFSLNHTCAMFRANVSRLIRKTWCTTKRIQPLIDHLEIYVYYHNHHLI